MDNLLTYQQMGMNDIALEEVSFSLPAGWTQIRLASIDQQQKCVQILPGVNISINI